MVYTSYMGKMNNKYQTGMTKRLSLIQENLNSGKITQEEFNILLGLLLKVEVNRFVKHQVKHLDLEDDKKMTFIGYAGTRKLSTI